MKKLLLAFIGIPCVIGLTAIGVFGQSEPFNKPVFVPYLAGFENSFRAKVVKFGFSGYSKIAAGVAKKSPTRYLFRDSTSNPPLATHAKAVTASEGRVYFQSTAGDEAAVSPSESAKPYVEIRSTTLRNDSGVSVTAAFIRLVEEATTGSLPVPTPATQMPSLLQPALPGGLLGSGGWQSILQTAPDDSYYSEQWGLSALGIESAWQFNSGSGITIAVIDTGVEYTHADLAGNMWSNPGEIAGNGIDDDRNGYIDDVRGWCFRDDTNDIMDVDGHGTHVSGIIGALRNNGIGISGVAPQAKVMGLRVFTPYDEDLYAIVDAIIDSVRYATDMGARVISLSLGLQTTDFAGSQFTRFQQAVQYAQSRGSIVVAAAGNNAGVMNIYPALYSEVISVGALYKSSISGSVSRDWYSAYGTQLDFMAPGTDILSLRSADAFYNNYNGDDQYMLMSGTSMATPMVSGVIALLLAQDPLQTFDDIYRRLRFSATEKGALGFDAYNGWGMINPFRALSEDYFNDAKIKRRYTPAADLYDIVRTDYDTAGNITARYDAGGNRAAFEFYPSTTKIQRIKFYDGTNTLVKTLEYYDNGTSIYRRIYNDGRILEYDSAGWVKKENCANGDVIWYYASGNRQKISELASGKIFEYLDENFFGNQRGRYSKTISADGTYAVYDEYWAGTDKTKRVSFYSSAGIFTKSLEYYSDGLKLSREVLASGIAYEYFESGNLKSDYIPGLYRRLDYSDAAGRIVERLRYAGDPSSSMGWDDYYAYTSDRRTQIDSQTQTPSVLEWRILYNRAGQKIREFYFNSNQTLDKILFYDPARPDYPFSMELYNGTPFPQKRTLYNPDGSIILSDGGSGTGGLLGRSAILQTAGVPAQDALPAMVQSRLDMFEVLHGQSGLMSREGPQEPKTGRLAPRP